MILYNAIQSDVKKYNTIRLDMIRYKYSAGDPQNIYLFKFTDVGMDKTEQTADGQQVRTILQQLQYINMYFPGLIRNDDNCAVFVTFIFTNTVILSLISRQGFIVKVYDTT